MSADLINWKTYRKINGIIRAKRNEIFKSYFFSVSFLYMISFAFLHYFYGQDTIFLTTFGVVFIEMISSFVYYTLYLLQKRRDGINTACENKKIEKPYRIPLIDKNIGEEGTIAALKIIVFFIYVAILVIYYGVFGYILQQVKFMSVSNAFEFIMFFMSVAYFDIFFEGGFKSVIPNLNRIKDLTKNDKIIKKMVFCMLILAVAIYQFYTLFTDLMLFISTLC